MKLHHAKRWEKTRARGLIRFLVIQGCLLWAGLSVVTWAFLMWLFGNWQPVFEHNAAHPFRFVSVLVIAGCGWGLFVWYWNEWTYRRYTRRTRSLEAEQDEDA
jgi:hypothetical protein